MPSPLENGFRRLSTGHPEADEVLGGGFPEHSINIVMGHPGTGKTIFAEQMLFHNAAPGRKALYLTTLSEPLEKVLTYLQRFEFFDEEKLLGGILYEDMGRRLAEEGVGATLDRVREAIRTDSPRIIVIDSFKAVHDMAQSDSEMRRLASELSGVLSAYDVTTFLVGEYAEESIARYPEFAVADGIVQLVRKATGKRDERYLRVLKLRGSAYREGLHAFRITSRGLEVYPRIVTPPMPEGHELPRERIPTGIPGLDPLIEGGLWRGSNTLLKGETGSGKTTLALGFAMEGVRRGEPSLYLNLQENPIQLGWTLTGLYGEAEPGGLHLQYASPVELQVDSILVSLFRTIEQEGIQRLAIDSLGDLALAAGERERFHDYLYSLLQYLTVRGITSMTTLETPASPFVTDHDIAMGFSSIADAVIELGVDVKAEPPTRTLRVVKARGSAHHLSVHPMVIGSDGVRLAQRASSA